VLGRKFTKLTIGDLTSTIALDAIGYTIANLENVSIHVRKSFPVEFFLLKICLYGGFLLKNMGLMFGQLFAL